MSQLLGITWSICDGVHSVLSRFFLRYIFLFSGSVMKLPIEFVILLML